MKRGKPANRIVLALAMFAAALQVSAPAFAANHATDHAAHNAMLIAQFGDLSRVTVRANPPTHDHDPGETCSVNCTTCKSQAQGAAFVLAAHALDMAGFGRDPAGLFAATIAPRTSLRSLAAPRAPPALIL